MDGEIMLKN